jgi:glycosidase
MSLPGATLEGAMMHTAFVLATRGIPQLYYGEELAMTGGHDPDNRKDFAGGWFEDSKNKFTRADRSSDEQKMFDWTQKWIKLRKENRALREGKTMDLFYDSEAYLFGRYFEEDKSLRLRKNNYVVFGVNLSKDTKRISLPKMKFSQLNDIKLVLDETNQRLVISPLKKAKVKLEDNGNITLELPPKSICLFQANFQISIEN